MQSFRLGLTRPPPGGIVPGHAEASHDWSPPRRPPLLQRRARRGRARRRDAGRLLLAAGAERGGGAAGVAAAVAPRADGRTLGRGDRAGAARAEHARGRPGRGAACGTRRDVRAHGLRGRGRRAGFGGRRPARPLQRAGAAAAAAAGDRAGGGAEPGLRGGPAVAVDLRGAAPAGRGRLRSRGLRRRRLHQTRHARADHLDHRARPFRRPAQRDAAVRGRPAQAAGRHQRHAQRGDAAVAHRRQPVAAGRVALLRRRRAGHAAAAAAPQLRPRSRHQRHRARPQRRGRRDAAAPRHPDRPGGRGGDLLLGAALQPPAAAHPGQAAGADDHRAGPAEAAAGVRRQPGGRDRGEQLRGAPQARRHQCPRGLAKRQRPAQAADQRAGAESRRRDADRPARPAGGRGDLLQPARRGDHLAAAPAGAAGGAAVDRRRGRAPDRRRQPAAAAAGPLGAGRAGRRGRRRRAGRLRRPHRGRLRRLPRQPRLLVPVGQPPGGRAGRPAAAGARAEHGRLPAAGAGRRAGGEDGAPLGGQ